MSQQVLVDGPVVLFDNRDMTFVVEFGEYVDGVWTPTAEPAGGLYTAEIRAKPDPTSTLLGTFTVDASQAVSGGRLTLTLEVANITPAAAQYRKGVFDIKRTIGVQEVSVLENSPVVFRSGATA